MSTFQEGIQNIIKDYIPGEALSFYYGNDHKNINKTKMNLKKQVISKEQFNYNKEI